MVLQGLGIIQGHDASSSGQLEKYYVYLLEVEFMMVEKTSTKVMDHF